LIWDCIISINILHFFVMNRAARVILILFLAQASIPAAHAQREERRERHRSDGFYISLGTAVGPTFNDFFDYINDRYQPSKPVGEFGSNIDFSVGYISRFHRNFALDAGFSLYGLKRKGEFINQNSALPESSISHELEYQAAIFTGTLPIYLEFSSAQPVVPYVGMGVSIFSMRLDDFRDATYPGQGILSEATRDTRTAVGAHFEAGLAVKLNRRFWIDLRGRWHTGQGHLATLENEFRDFSIRQYVSQYTLGVDYFFR